MTISQTLYTPKVQFHFQIAGSSNMSLLEACVEIPPLDEEAPQGFSLRLRERFTHSHWHGHKSLLKIWGVGRFLLALI